MHSVYFFSVENSLLNWVMDLLEGVQGKKTYKLEEGVCLNIDTNCKI